MNILSKHNNAKWNATSKWDIHNQIRDNIFLTQIVIIIVVIWGRPDSSFVKSRVRLMLVKFIFPPCRGSSWTRTHPYDSSPTAYISGCMRAAKFFALITVCGLPAICAQFIWFISLSLFPFFFFYFTVYPVCCCRGCWGYSTKMHLFLKSTTYPPLPDEKYNCRYSSSSRRDKYFSREPRSLNYSIAKEVFNYFRKLLHTFCFLQACIYSKLEYAARGYLFFGVILLLSWSSRGE